MLPPSSFQSLTKQINLPTRSRILKTEGGCHAHTTFVHSGLKNQHKMRASLSSLGAFFPIIRKDTVETDSKHGGRGVKISPGTLQILGQPRKPLGTRTLVDLFL